MKRVLAIGLVLIVCIFGGFYLFDMFKLNKEDYEFTAFQNFLNENFFPVLNDAFKHFDQAADTLEDETFLDWYLNLEGMEENEALQAEIAEAERNIFDEEVKGPNSLSLKKNILEQIVVLQETFDLLDSAVKANNVPSNKLHQGFTANIKELSSLSEEMNMILKVNDDKEEAGSF